MTPLTITIAHQLGRAEARRRIEAGFTNMLQQFPGSSGVGAQRWDGDRLSFGLTVLGQSVSGVVVVGDTAVTMDIMLPGVLGMVAAALKNRLKEAGQLLLMRK